MWKAKVYDMYQIASFPSSCNCGQHKCTHLCKRRI